MDFAKRLAELEKRKLVAPAVLRMSDGTSVAIRATRKHLSRLDDAAFARLRAELDGFPPPPATPLDAELDAMSECESVREVDGQQLELMAALLKSVALFDPTNLMAFEEHDRKGS